MFWITNFCCINFLFNLFFKCKFLVTTREIPSEPKFRTILSEVSHKTTSTRKATKKNRRCLEGIKWEKKERKKRIIINRIQPMFVLFFAFFCFLSFWSELDVATLYQSGERLVGWTDSYSIKIIILEFLLYFRCCFFFVCFFQFPEISFQVFGMLFLIYFSWMLFKFVFDWMELGVVYDNHSGGRPVACSLSGMIFFSVLFCFLLLSMSFDFL